MHTTVATCFAQGKFTQVSPTIYGTTDHPQVSPNGLMTITYGSPSPISTSVLLAAWDGFSQHVLPLNDGAFFSYTADKLSLKVGSVTTLPGSAPAASFTLTANKHKGTHTTTMTCEINSGGMSAEVVVATYVATK